MPYIPVLLVFSLVVFFAVSWALEGMLSNIYI